MQKGVIKKQDLAEVFILMAQVRQNCMELKLLNSSLEKIRKMADRLHKSYVQ